MALYEKQQLEAGFRLGDWQVLPLRSSIERGDETIRLEPGVMDVLMALARRNGDLVTRDQLVDEVWGGRATADGPIDRRIAALRKAFGDQSEPRQYIETLTKRGYRLLKPVELPEPEPETRPVDPPATVAGDSGLVRWAVGLAAVAVVVWALWPRADMSGFESIAVLPFDNLSQDPGDEYLVLGFKQELVQTLLTIDGLMVKNVHSKDMGQSVEEIARELDVDTVLYGSLERTGNVIKVRFTIETGQDGVTLEAGNVSGDRDDLFSLQEQLAQLVQKELYPEATQVLTSRSKPASPEAYNEYLLGYYAFDRRGQPGFLEEAIERFEATISLDPQFGPAYLQLATAYALLPDYRGADLEEYNSLAIETVDTGIERDPSIEAAAGAVYGFVHHKRKEWRRSQEAYERALSGRVVDVNAFNWYSRMLASVGDLHGALDIARRGRELDPDSPVLNSRLAMSYTWLGNNEQAREYFELSNRLGAGGPTHLMAYAFLLSRVGDLEASFNAAEQGLGAAGLEANWLGPMFEALADPAAAGRALAAVDAASKAGQMTAQVEVVVRTILGDLDGAMRIAERLEEPGEVFEMDLLFAPELSPLRLHPGFEPLMVRLGVAAYWQSNSCVFVDGNVSCPDA